MFEVYNFFAIHLFAKFHGSSSGFLNSFFG